MPELVLVKRDKVSPGTKVTPGALMPKILCCLEAGAYKVFVGRTCERVFKQQKNALKKMAKLNAREGKKALNILKLLNYPTLSQKKRLLKKHDKHIGFDNVI